MLTVEKLDDLEPGTIFATGLARDVQGDLYMADTGSWLRWVAVVGGIHDWTIYCHFRTESEEFVKAQGDKVCCEDHIKRLVPCTDEAFRRYRL